jgi:hypothetical protein
VIRVRSGNRNGRATDIDGAFENQLGIDIDDRHLAGAGTDDVDDDAVGVGDDLVTDQLAHLLAGEPGSPTECDHAGGVVSETLGRKPPGPGQQTVISVAE